MRHVLIAAVLGTALCTGPQTGVSHAALLEESETAAIEARIAALAQIAGGRVGVMAFSLESGLAAGHNADEAFPMASTFKIAVAAAVLARVDAGELPLDTMVDIPQERYVLSDVIANRLIHPGVALSVANLIELNITESDNTAADMLTELAGGPQAVTQWLRAQGIEDQRVDRDTAGLIRDFFALPDGPLVRTVPAALEADPQIFQRGQQPNPDFDADPRDTSSPRAMARLIARIAQGEALSEASTEFLLASMGRTRTGAGRLRGLLPGGTQIAHKTGTIGGTVNDAGLITLPDGRRIVVVVFVKESAAPIAERERAIAEITRTLHDWFLVR
ncbi:class A beta-lactamase [Glycocaulis abyssi]|uniref:Beta-lactamase n=1 Tax=Glycocaulis abyssi TaxID=1433403 RepID=A0ABV9NF99_9PROT